MKNTSKYDDKFVALASICSLLGGAVVVIAKGNYLWAIYFQTSVLLIIALWNAQSRAEDK